MHLKSTKAKKNFVKRKIKIATPKETAKIYSATEKAIGYKKKKGRKVK